MVETWRVPWSTSEVCLLSAYPNYVLPAPSDVLTVDELAYPSRVDPISRIFSAFKLRVRTARKARSGPGPRAKDGTAVKSGRRGFLSRQVSMIAALAILTQHDPKWPSELT